MNSAAFPQLTGILETDGLLAGLEFLNARVEHRFTGLYRLEDGLIRKAHLVDKRGGAGLPYHNEIKLEQSLSRFALRDGVFQAGDTIVDPRLADYRFAGMVGSCFILRVVDGSGRPWGTLIHFDMINRVLPAAEEAFLREVPPLFIPFL